MVFTNVPAEVCQICGKAYLKAATTEHLLHIVEEAVLAGVQVDVRSYAASTSPVYVEISPWHKTALSNMGEKGLSFHCYVYVLSHTR